jgi:hypothetical protein
MFSPMVKKSVSVTLSLFVVVFTSGTGFSYQISSPAPSSNDNSPIHAAPQTADELQALVAPIALYPDSLVAQILTGSTFPDQIAIGDYWIEQNKNLTGSALATRILTTAILRSGEGPSFLIALVKPYPQDPNYAQTCKTYQFPAQYVAPRLAFGNQKIMTAKREHTCESGTAFSVTFL